MPPPLTPSWASPIGFRHRRDGIGALISGFNKGISVMLGSLGPKTFWVGRYWGGQDEDPKIPIHGAPTP